LEIKTESIMGAELLDKYLELLAKGLDAKLKGLTLTTFGTKFVEEKVNKKMDAHEVLYKVIGKAHVLAWGPPETGKTHAAYEVAKLLKRDIVRGNCTPDTSGAEWRGFWAPSKDGFCWQEGLAVKAIKKNGILLIDDIHLAGPDLLAVLYPMLDRHPIDLPNGEVVETSKAHVYATSNEDPRNLPVSELSEVAMKSLGDMGECILKAGVWKMRSVRAFSRLVSELGLEEAANIVFGSSATGIIDSIKIAESTDIRKD
jgi:DNA polymerase III delta prime subunit